MTKTLKKNKNGGGRIEDLKEMDPSKNYIILMGELHATNPNYGIRNSLAKPSKEDFIISIQKQIDIIDYTCTKYEKKNILFYTEIPKENIDYLNTNMVSSLIVSKKAKDNFKKNFFMSEINTCQRNQKGACDDLYALDIVKKITENHDCKCIIVQIGLLHLNEVEKILNKLIKEIKLNFNIISINTVPFTHKTNNRNKMKPILNITRNLYPSYKGKLSYNTEKSHHLQSNKKNGLFKNAAKAASSQEPFKTNKKYTPYHSNASSASPQELFRFNKQFKQFNEQFNEPFKTNKKSFILPSTIISVSCNYPGANKEKLDCVKCTICGSISGINKIISHYFGCTNKIQIK